MTVSDGPASRRESVRSFRRLLTYTNPYRRKLLLAIGCAVTVALTLPAIPFLVREAIDRAIVPDELSVLVPILAGMMAIAVTKAVCHGFRRQLAGEVAVAAEADLREHLYEHVQALDVGYHERISTGQIMSRASSDINAVRQYLMTVPWSLTLALQVLVVFVLMFVLNPTLATLFTLTTPALAFSTHRFAKAFDPVVWRIQQSLGNFASGVEETVVGIRVVKAFGREDHQVHRLSRDADDIYEAAMESIRLRGRFVPLYNLVPQLGLATVLWVGGRQVVAGTETVGTMVALFSYLFMLVWPLRALGMVVAWAQRATTSAGRIFEILDTQPGIGDHPGARPLEVDACEIAFSDVRFAYPDGATVLDGVDLRIEGGTSLALVGPTGCGKSTLLRLVPRFIEPTAGHVTIDGQDVSEITLHSLRSALGIVFEDTLLFSDTVAANIAFGRPDATEEEIVQAAATAQAHDFVCEMPDGYRSMVGEHGYTLSGGQRQRIAIARAVLMRPRVLLLDDATSNVDARVEAQIRAGLERAMHGRTTLIVARRPSTASLADRVAYMERGRIVAVGTHDELWTTTPAYREALVAEGGGSVDDLAEVSR